MIWKLIGLIPGGQVIGLIGAVARGVAALVAAIVEAVTVTLANPVVFLIVALGFGVGVYEGVRWQHHRVAVVKAELDAKNAEWKRANEAEKTRTSEALKAQTEAEALAKAVEDKAKQPVARAPASGQPRRVRERAAPTAPDQPGWSLPGVQAVFGRH